MNLEGEEKRTRRVVAVASCVIVLALGAVGSTWYTQRQATQRAQRVSTWEEKTAALNKKFETPRAEVDKASAQARVLRGKWQAWAREHKADVSKMLQGDRAAMDKVWVSLPYTPSARTTPGFSAKDLCPDGEPGTGSCFGWGPLIKADSEAQIQTIADSKERQYALAELKAQPQVLQDNFDSQKDILLATAMSPGRTHVSLWASGRITEQTRLPAEQRLEILKKVRALGRPPRPSDLWGPHQEIEPPYDFLQ